MGSSVPALVVVWFISRVWADNPKASQTVNHTILGQGGANIQSRPKGPTPAGGLAIGMKVQACCLNKRLLKTLFQTRPTKT